MIKLFSRLRAVSVHLKNLLSSFNSQQIKELVFYLLYFIVFLFLIFRTFSFLKGFLIIFVFVTIWKIIAGISWRNFLYLILNYIEFYFLSSWLKPFWLIVITILSFWLFLGSIILCQKSKDFLSYFIIINWILMCYGLYFYFSWPFITSFIIYLIGLSIISFFNFLALDKKISLNYWVYLLVNLEIYWLLTYLSLNGLKFTGLIFFFQYFLLSFV